MPLIPSTDPLLRALQSLNPSYSDSTAPVILSAWAEGMAYHGLAEADEAMTQSIQDHARAFLETLLADISLDNTAWILLSSGHVYGESEMICGDCGPQGIYHRADHPVGKFKWEALCPLCNELMAPKPHAETDALTTTQPIGLWFQAVETQLAALLPEQSLTVLRIFQPYWPVAQIASDTSACLVMHLASLLLNNTPIVIDEDGNQTRCVTWVGDINQAIVRTQQQPPSEKVTIYNVATLSTLALFSLVALLQEATQKTDVPFTISQHYPYPSPRHRSADTRKIEAELGFVRSASSPLDMMAQLQLG